MTRSKGKKLPGFRSRAEIVSFFESHDLGDYADQLPEAKLDFAITRRTLLVPIDEHLFAEVRAIAESKKLSAEKLIDSWLRERISHNHAPSAKPQRR